MTEESFQAGKKFMASANCLRSGIIKAKGIVAKWTKLESWYIQEKKQLQAAASRKNLENAIDRLKILRQKFAELKFPESNIESTHSHLFQCQICGTSIKEGQEYCSDCNWEIKIF